MYRKFRSFINIVSTNKRFFKLWLSQVFTQSSLNIILINIGILSHEGILSASTKDSAASIGFLVALSTVPGLVFAPIAGVFADWYRKKSIMILSNLIRFVILIVFIFFRGWENATVSYLLILLFSIVYQFFVPAEGGLIPKLIDKKYILLANSLFSITIYTSLAFGVTISGIILSIFGTQTTFIICSLMLLASAYFVSKINIEEEKKEEKSIFYLIEFVKKLITDVKAGIVYSFRNTKVRFALLHMMVLQVVGLTLVTIVFRIGTEIYGVSPRTAGIVVFAPLIIGLIVGLFIINVYARKKSRVKLIWIGTILSSVAFGLMAIISLANGLLIKYLIVESVATVSLFAVGFSVPFLLVPAQTIMYEHTEADFRGRVLGLWLALTSSVASLLAMCVGFLTDRVDDVVLAIVIIVIADIFYSMILRLLIKKKII